MTQPINWSGPEEPVTPWTPEQIREHRAAFLAALRSGEYTQGYGTLTIVERDGSERHCCLGVACTVAVKAGAIQRLRVVEYGDDGSVVGNVRYGLDDNSYYGYDTELLPRPMQGWLGIHRANPTLVPGMDAAHLNDDAKLTFPQMADLFEYFFANVAPV
jgi:hypothetical protein